MSTTTDFFGRRLVPVFLGLIALLAAGTASANLMLHPTRIVFDKNQRAAQVELVNNGSSTLTYRISLVNRRMNETGEFSDAHPPLPDEQFADTMLRHSPRQVVLAPGASQTVRIQLRKPAELAAGEYRSHLTFAQIGDTATDARGGTNDGVEIKLTPLIGASIPVIVRHGATAASATLANLKLERDTPNAAPVLAFEMRREGNRSLYGDLIVMHAADGGSEQLLVRVNGVAVYTPNTLRRLRIALPATAAQARGTLRLVLQERAEDGAKPLAQAQLPLR